MHTYLEKRDPRKWPARFYRMAILANFFGEWTLKREWGRIVVQNYKKEKSIN